MPEHNQVTRKSRPIFLDLSITKNKKIVLQASAVFPLSSLQNLLFLCHSTREKRRPGQRYFFHTNALLLLISLMYF